MGSVSALLLTQPASPADQSWGSAYRTDFQEIPEAVVELNKVFSRDALLSEHVQDSTLLCLLYGCSPRIRHATTPMWSTSLGASLYKGWHNWVCVCLLFLCEQDRYFCTAGWGWHGRKEDVCKWPAYLWGNQDSQGVWGKNVPLWQRSVRWKRQCYKKAKHVH